MDILVEQEIELHQYEVRQSKSDIKRLIHPSFTEVGKSGNSFNFVSIMDMMESEELTNSRIYSQNYECIQLEPSVQLLKYESAIVNRAGQVIPILLINLSVESSL